MSIEKVIEGLTAAIEKQTTAIEALAGVCQDILSAPPSSAPSALPEVDPQRTADVAPPKKKAKKKAKATEDAPAAETTAAEHPMPTPTAPPPAASPLLEGPALQKFIVEIGEIVRVFGAAAGEIHEILNAPPYSVERVSELTVAQSVAFLAECKALKESKGL